MFSDQLRAGRYAFGARLRKESTVSGQPVHSLRPSTYGITWRGRYTYNGLTYDEPVLFPGRVRGRELARVLRIIGRDASEVDPDGIYLLNENGSFRHE
jgi:hypothetical protein